MFPRHASGLGLVNSSSPNLFKSITKEQVEAATEFLSSDISDSKDGESNRYFNFDAAKLLYVFTSLVVSRIDLEKSLIHFSHLLAFNLLLSFMSIPMNLFARLSK